MDWTRPIDIYCERVSAAFWAEPLNALTNLAFIAAGLGALALSRRSSAGRGPWLWLSLLMAGGIVALLSQVIGAVWAATATDAPLSMVVVTTLASIAVLGIALTFAPARFPDPGVPWPVLWLSANAVVVGVGSFLFHTVATPWAGFADTGPIMMFILGFFAVTMNRFAGLGWGRAAAVTFGFLLGMVALSAGLRVVVGDLAGGSQSYVPALVALLGVGAWLHAAREHPAGRALMQAGGVFAVSLTFRSLDGPLCEMLPIGTHFLWHVLNGLVFWILLRALVRHGDAPGLRPARA